MKITKVLAITAVGLSIVSCNNSQVKTQTSLNSVVDSVSYAIGLDASRNLSSLEELNPDLFIQGYLEGRDTTGTDLIDKKEVNAFLTSYFNKKKQLEIKKKEAEIAEKFKDYKKENEDFLAKNKSEKGINVTPSGLQYIVLEEGKGEKPTISSKVKVHYHGTLIDGTVFDSSVEKGKPIEFGVTQVIKGWTEGLQLMNKGSKFKFFIPQELAYGARQQPGSTIKPFSTLVFEVSLLDIKNPLPKGHSANDGHKH